MPALKVTCVQRQYGVETTVEVVGDLKTWSDEDNDKLGDIFIELIERAEGLPGYASKKQHTEDSEKERRRAFAIKRANRPKQT